MNKSVKSLIGALALLGASASMAATIVATPSAGNPIAPGASFSVLVSGAGFPETAGATLGLTWNTSVVAVTSVVLATGSPFQTIVAASPFNLVTVLGPLVGTQPSGSFDAFQINFNALAAGAANISLNDDQGDFCWTDANTNACVPVVYNQANVTVGAAVPVPAAAWLVAPAVLAAGRFSRRRKAA
jgi:hypothetical protein